MSAASYWDTGPGDPGRPVLKFTKVKDKLVPVMPVSPIPCTLCKKPFYQFVHLQQHSRCHSGMRPFRCHRCHCNFMQLSHLKKHQMIKHDVQKKCKSCGAVFQRLSAFIHHTVQKHGVKALTLPKLPNQKSAQQEEPQKRSIKLCIKKSMVNMAEDHTKSANWTVKKRKKHKKHKKDAKKSKNKEPVPKAEKLKSSEPKPRIILKFKIQDCSVSESPSPSVNSNGHSSGEQKMASTSAAATPGNKAETFTDLVQSPSPKDSGIDDCSPLHETDHNENCSANGNANKQGKAVGSVLTTETALSSSTVSAPAQSPRRPTRQDAVLRSLMSAKDGRSVNSGSLDHSTPSTPNSKSMERSLRKARSSQIKEEANCSPNSIGEPNAGSSSDLDYLVPPSPVPSGSLKLTISKKPAGKLRGSKNSYTSSLHMQPADFIPPSSPSGSIISKSPRSSPASPRLSKRQHSPFKARSIHEQTDSPRQLIYSPNTSVPCSPRPDKRQRGKSPKLCRLESSETVYSSGQPSLSPPHSLKSERDFGPLSVDIDDDPYAFDDDPSNNSPHLLPYTSTLPRRSDKYKLDPPVLEPQILPSLSAPNNVKNPTRPRLTKQVDLKKRKSRKSPVRSNVVSKECKAQKLKERKNCKLTEPLITCVKQEILDDVEMAMPSLKQNMPLSSDNNLTLDLNPVSDITRSIDIKKMEGISQPIDTGRNCKNDADEMAASVETSNTLNCSDSIPNPALPKPGLAIDGDCSVSSVLPSDCSAASNDRTNGSLSVVETSLMSEHCRHTVAVTDIDRTNAKCVEMECSRPVPTHSSKDLLDTSLPPLLDVMPLPQPMGPSDLLNERSDAITSDTNVNESTSELAPIPPPAATNSKSKSFDVGEMSMDDVVSTALNDSDLLLSDPHLENLSFNDSFLDLADDVAADATGDNLFDHLQDEENSADLPCLETASKASSESSRKKVESDPIVVTLPGEAGMEPISLVIENDDSDHFGESDGDFELASSLSSTALPPIEGGAIPDISLSMSQSSTPVPTATATAATSVSDTCSIHQPSCAAAAAVVDTDSEFADLQAAYSPVEPQVASAQGEAPAAHHATGFFNAFANFVGAKSDSQSEQTLTQSPGYSSEFAKFLSQKSVLSDERCSVDSDMISDSKEWTKAEISSLKQNHLQVQNLCEKVWRLLRTLFPHLELPVYMSGSSPCGIEVLIDQVVGIITEKDSSSSAMQTCSEPSIALCSQPVHCLAHLRTKVCNLLVTIIPQLTLPPTFNQSGEDVDNLLSHVIDSNVT